VIRKGGNALEAEDIETDEGYRRYTRRQYRQHRVYWRLIPIAALAVLVGFATGDATDGLLLAIAGLLFMLVLALREIQDMVGYLSSVRHDELRCRDSILKELTDIKRHIVRSEE